MWKKIKDSILSFAITALYVYLLILVVEWIYRGSFHESYIWLKGKTKPFAYNFIILFPLFSVLRLFRRKLYILLTFIMTVPFIVLAIASRIKLEIRGEPVLPPDLLLSSEAANMMDFFTGSIVTWMIVGAVILIGLLVFTIIKVPNQKQRNGLQITLAVLFLFAFLGVYHVEAKQEGTYLKRNLKISKFVWNQKETTAIDGVVGAFLQNMDLLTIEKPKNYSQQTIEEIIAQTKESKSSESEQPNVVVIMSEAFWDPTLLTNVEFNKDPIPFFHKMQKEQSGGMLAVPVFGGSTANTEFEALTGVSTQFLPAGSVPYLNYVTKPIPALPNIFRQSGYETTAIHSFHHWFYQRSYVYKNLGFDRFVSLEYMTSPIRDGNFYHDKTMTDEIMRKINRGNKPNFIFAVTTQNHGPYSSTGKKKYASIEAELTNGNKFSPDTKNILEVYSDNLAEIDKQLERLITELNNTKRKTIVVFFGDHLPILGSDYKVYREAGYYNEADDFDEYKRMHTTPLLVWDNFSGKKEELNIGASLVAPILLDRVGVKGNYLTNYLFDQYQEGSLNRITRPDFLAEDHVNDTVLSDIKQLQYDLLFGKMYGIADKQVIQPSKSYRLGYKDPKITTASMEMDGDKKMLLLKGEYFTEQSYVYVNDKYIARVSGDETEIRLPFPDKKDNFTIVVKVMDSNNKILSQSNTFSYEN
ncbi:LTA synthase family protein [Neobacillus sp. NPDC093127]|uniref:LTA synthase family protein n=1 Tax=Neobacillus sp. NPDC093127 TaxID=3364296 RepID=UPI0038274FFF